MESYKGEKEENIENYPVLKYSGYTGAVVLFIAPHKGTRVFLGDKAPSDRLGEYSETWEEKTMKIYTGKITLQN